MRAAVLTEHGVIELEEREPPDPGPDEIVVNLVAVGIRGSDLHYYEHGRIGDYVVESPLVLGHESAGVVGAVGENVSDHAVGDRVALEPGVPCSHCEYYRDGRYNLCPDVTFVATPPDDGAFVESIAWSADYAFELPSPMSLAGGALAEPVSVGINACRRGDVGAGDSLLVTGAARSGSSRRTSRTRSARQTWQFRARRSQAATRERARCDVDPVEEDVPAAIAARGSDDPDVAIEATGDPRALQDCIDAVRRGGTVVCVGLGAKATSRWT